MLLNIYGYIRVERCSLCNYHFVRISHLNLRHLNELRIISLDELIWKSILVSQRYCAVPYLWNDTFLPNKRTWPCSLRRSSAPPVDQSRLTNFKKINIVNGLPPFTPPPPLLTFEINFSQSISPISKYPKIKFKERKS